MLTAKNLGFVIFTVVMPVILYLVFATIFGGATRHRHRLLGDDHGLMAAYGASARR